jgi:hypothetical protein
MTKTPHPTLSPKRLCRNREKLILWKRGEAVGRRRFRAEPLLVWIETCQGDENVWFCTIVDLASCKRPAF